ncbi:hypothetical protein JCM1393_02250 [Clostridium carnis]
MLILNKLAVIKYPINAEFVEKYIIKNDVDKSEFLSLKSLRIIQEIVDGKITIVEFKRYLDKKIIYSRIKTCTVRRLKVELIELIELECHTDNTLIEELLYQLEGIEGSEKLVIYYKKYASFIEEKTDIEKALYYYKMAFTNCIDVNENSLELSFKISKLYIDLKEKEEVIIYLNKCLDIAKKLGKLQYIINSYIAKASIEDINEVVKDCNRIYFIDWDNINILKDEGNLPDWNSVCIVPVLKNGEVVAVFYFSVSVNEKEFNFKEYNYIKNLCQISSMIF